MGLVHRHLDAVAGGHDDAIRGRHVAGVQYEQIADEDFGDGDGCFRAPAPGPDATPALGARVEALELRLFLRVVERGDDGDDGDGGEDGGSVDPSRGVIITRTREAELQGERERAARDEYLERVVVQGA